MTLNVLKRMISNLLRKLRSEFMVIIGQILRCLKLHMFQQAIKIMILTNKTIHYLMRFIVNLPFPKISLYLCRQRIRLMMKRYLILRILIDLSTDLKQLKMISWMVIATNLMILSLKEMESIMTLTLILTKWTPISCVLNISKNTRKN